MSLTLPTVDDAAERLRALATLAAPTAQVRPDLAERLLDRARRARRMRRLRTAAVTAAGGLVIATAVAAATLTGRTPYFTVTEPSAAMEPTIMVSERVVFDRDLAPGRGDVVLVRLVRDGHGYDSMQRVVAIAGDTIGCPAGPSGRCEAIVVNGSPLREPYLRDLDATAIEPFPTSTVPAHTVFLFGDNRSVAYDSRYLGPVRVTDVSGVAVRIIDRHGRARAVPGAPPHRGPGDTDNVDPPGRVPPAVGVPTD
jgi:signal peptidase I